MYGKQFEQELYKTDPAAYEQQLYEHGIMNVCLDLRMSCDGSADPIPNAEKEAVISYLKKRLAEWRPPTPPTGAAFDECVRQLVIATLAEVGDT